MFSTKRVLLAYGSRLIREMLHQALDRTDHLKVVEQISDSGGLPLALKQFEPDWVIFLLPYTNQARNWLQAYMENYPTVRFIFLSPGQNHIKMKWQTFHEEEHSDLSLREFIDILEKDLQHT